MYNYAIGLGYTDMNPAEQILTYKQRGGDTRKKRSRLRWEWFLMMLRQRRLLGNGTGSLMR